LVQITYYTRPNYADHPNVNMHWIHWIEKFFTIQDFIATCACPKILPWNFSLYWIYFLLFRIYEQVALVLKNRVCPEFTVLNIHFLSFRIFEQLALALQSEFALKFFMRWGSSLHCPPVRLVRQWLSALGFQYISWNSTRLCSSKQWQWHKVVLR